MIIAIVAVWFSRAVVVYGLSWLLSRHARERTAFDQIRHYGAGDQRVIKHLRKTLDSVELCLQAETARQIVAAYHQEVINGLNYAVMLSEAETRW